MSGLRISVAWAEDNGCWPVGFATSVFLPYYFNHGRMLFDISIFN